MFDRNNLHEEMIRRLFYRTQRNLQPSSIGISSRVYEMKHVYSL